MQFLKKYGAYFGGDARFDLWVYSPVEKATLVWDRHNLLYAYGRLPSFIECLMKMGYKMESLQVPAPHVHHYRKEFDEVAKDFLNYFKWSISPLRPEDEQFKE